MSIGTAVLISSLFIGVIILYVATKDRWQWSRAFRTVGLTLSLLIAAAGLTGLGFYFWPALMPATIPAQYAGIKLGMSQGEVLYIKGMPATVRGIGSADPWEEKLTHKIEQIPKGKKVQDFGVWQYELSNAMLYVSFNKDRSQVFSILCIASDFLGSCPEIGGIKVGSSEADVLRRFGRPDEAEIKEMTKYMDYRQLGVVFGLMKESVLVLIVKAPDSNRK